MTHSGDAAAAEPGPPRDGDEFHPARNRSGAGRVPATDPTDENDRTGAP
ncbi:hypothetical protein [Actinopolyspora erythraea]|nr:hypothetical protein [Actinopolyspora erythraea]